MAGQGRKVMDVAIVKRLIRNHIEIAERKKTEQLQSGEDGLVEQVVIMTLNDILNSIESYEIDDDDN
jgi:hypothetical protein